MATWIIHDACFIYRLCFVDYGNFNRIITSFVKLSETKLQTSTFDLFVEPPFAEHQYSVDPCMGDA